MGKLFIANLEDGVPDSSIQFQDILIVSIDRGSADATDYLSYFKRVYSLGRRRCVYLSFSGYDEDPRELVEIPECREMGRKIIEGLTGPETSVFVDDRKDSKLFGIIGLLSLCGLVDYKVSKDGTQRLVHQNTMDRIDQMYREEGPDQQKREE